MPVASIATERTPCSFSQSRKAVQLAGEGAEDLGRVPGDGDVEFFAADIDGGSLGIEHRQSFHKRRCMLS